MTATEPSNDERKEHIETDDTGARRVRTGHAEDVFAAVDVPNPIMEDGTISVAGYAYDDQEGQVELSIGGGVSVNVVLSPDEGRALADAIAGAVLEAEREVDE